jgi:hypothetical protein
MPPNYVLYGKLPYKTRSSQMARLNAPGFERLFEQIHLFRRVTPGE